MTYAPQHRISSRSAEIRIPPHAIVNDLLAWELVSSVWFDTVVSDSLFICLCAFGNPCFRRVGLLLRREVPTRFDGRRDRCHGHFIDLETGETVNNYTTCMILTTGGYLGWYRG